MKNNGCLIIIACVAAVFGFAYGTYWVLYAILVPKSAASLSFFQENTIAFYDYYTTYQFGTLPTRVIILTMATSILWFIFGMMELGISKVIKRKTWFSNRVHFFFFTLLLVSIIIALFIPKRMVEYNTESQTMKVTDYGSLCYFWTNPFPEERFEIPFEDITDIQYFSYQTNIRGAEHEEIMLYALTQNDTIRIGRTMIYHGEFGWITDWRSREEIIEAGKADANEVAGELIKLIKIKSRKNEN